jgi:putative acetyltransferase
LHRAAFGDHGAAVADLVDDLRRDPAALALVAVDGGTVVGHVMFTRSLLDAPRWCTRRRSGTTTRSGCAEPGA